MIDHLDRKHDGDVIECHASDAHVRVVRDVLHGINQVIESLHFGRIDMCDPVCRR